MLAGIGIILIVLGAIVTWAISAAVEGVDLQALGYILMAGGVLALLVAAVQGAGLMARGSSGMRTERHASPDGQHVVEETHFD